MGAGVFVLQELQMTSSGAYVPAEDGERFLWTSDSTPIDTVNGGARAIPLSPWTFGGTQRSERTDYPGAASPSEQVLGPAYKPFTLQGEWDDRYNFAGYAEQELRRFEAMCKRGRMVRIEFQGQAFECLIKDWDFPYKRKWQIGYQFSVSPHQRPSEFTASRSPATVQSATQRHEEAQIVADALATVQNTRVPAAAFAGSMSDDVATSLKDIDANIQRLGATLDTRQGALKPITDFRRIATQFRVIQSDAAGLIGKLVTVKSDTALTYRTAISVLEFEDFTRSARYYSRLLMGNSQRAGRDMEERAAPVPVRIHRPFKGESLYSVSRTYYGTPHAWRLIADRNNLNVFVLTGTEELLIPERGEG